MTKYELTPQQHDGVKSFYKKAYVIETDDHETILQSYETQVIKITANGEIVRLWDGYSATTMRHVNSFLSLMGINNGGKKYWDALTMEVK